MSNVGRPSAINPARMSAILVAIEDGNYFKHAATSAGVAKQTAYSWVQKGENYLASLRVVNPEIDAEVADWLMVWPDDFDSTNGMWDAPVPFGIEAEQWVFILFAVLMEKAKARAVVNAIKSLRKAGKKSWQSTAWWLERTHADDYGRQQTLRHEGSDGGPIQIGPVTPDALISKIREIRQEHESKKDE
jgi:hypothetical protein